MNQGKLKNSNGTEKQLQGKQWHQKTTANYFHAFCRVLKVNVVII